MLSVIIPTRNRAASLDVALKSVQSQVFPEAEFEILVIDNGSTDGTRQVVDSLRQSSGNVRYFFDPTPGLHVGRHRGLKEAQGEVLVYADDDIEATSTWLEAIHECFQTPRVALVGGNNYPKFEDTPPAWLQKLWRKPAYGGQAIPSLSVLQLPAGQRPVSPFSVWGCNFSIRRDVLLDAGGFHPDSMPDEHIRFRGDGETHVSAHVAKAGLNCLFDSRASVHHAVPKSRMTFEYFRKRAFNQGVSDSFSRLRNGHRRRQLSSISYKSAVAIARAVLGGVRECLDNLLSQDRELKDLDRVMQEGYREGYTYHQAVYRDDPEVRTWVHKSDYY